MENIFTQWFGDNLLTYVLITIPVVIYVSVFAVYAVLAERKISAWISNRIGPNRTDKYGLIQTILDAIKLVQKEIINPSKVGNVTSFNLYLYNFLVIRSFYLFSYFLLH